MQHEQQRASARESGREQQVPPSLTNSTRKSEREGDQQRLLNPGDPPLWTAQLREQTQRNNQTEHRAPAHIEHLIALLINISCETVDQVDQPEVDRQRSQGDKQSQSLQPSRAT